METNLGEQLDGAKMVRYDADRQLTLAWFGGHGVHAYTLDGTEVSFWNVDSFERDEARREAVEESMESTIKEGYYP